MPPLSQCIFDRAQENATMSTQVCKMTRGQSGPCSTAARRGDLWKYVDGNKRLAVQWSAWLTHTRPDPPTLEEHHADLAPQERIRHRAALLDARDRASAAASAVVSPHLLPSLRIPSPSPTPGRLLIPLPR
ncbi:hypothetical protein FB451DRAFT_1531212 [Mycena latifolia]|nr:hypothetical protein FB451DRAFT_1531212 [Mycena latifolia]